MTASAKHLRFVRTWSLLFPYDRWSRLGMRSLIPSAHFVFCWHTRMSLVFSKMTCQLVFWSRNQQAEQNSTQCLGFQAKNQVQIWTESWILLVHKQAEWSTQKRPNNENGEKPGRPKIKAQWKTNRKGVREYWFSGISKRSLASPTQ